ncbi:MAG: SufE family protein [Rhabdochlamydiaceae bacterium]
MSTQDDSFYSSCLNKQAQLCSIFNKLASREMKYEKIIAMGKDLPFFDPLFKIESNLVRGCQSEMFLRSQSFDGKMVFSVFSEALISSGLAALLLFVYNNESPECLLKIPPTFLKEIDIYVYLTPSRSNGLNSLHLKMKQEAMKTILNHH